MCAQELTDNVFASDLIHCCLLALQIGGTPIHQALGRPCGECGLGCGPASSAQRPVDSVSLIQSGVACSRQSECDQVH